LKTKGRAGKSYDASTLEWIQEKLVFDDGDLDKVAQDLVGGFHRYLKEKYRKRCAQKRSSYHKGERRNFVGVLEELDETKQAVATHVKEIGLLNDVVDDLEETLTGAIDDAAEQAVEVANLKGELAGAKRTIAAHVTTIAAQVATIAEYKRTDNVHVKTRASLNKMVATQAVKLKAFEEAEVENKALRASRADELAKLKETEAERNKLYETMLNVRSNVEEVDRAMGELKGAMKF
jgi:chromosome segregation ATPase